MADLKLDIAIIPTYNPLTLGIGDLSVYPSSLTITAPSIEFDVPSFGKVILPFNPKQYNLYNSTSLGITEIDQPESAIPDGVYTVKYTITPAYENFVEKTFMRVDGVLGKFDNAFMKLDLMECDRAIKTQDKVQLNSIYFFIQGAIAAANNCAVDEANRLYRQADKLLNNFVKGGCQCSGNNYITNFY